MSVSSDRDGLKDGYGCQSSSFVSLFCCNTTRLVCDFGYRKVMK